MRVFFHLLHLARLSSPSAQLSLSKWCAESACDALTHRAVHSVGTGICIGGKHVLAAMCFAFCLQMQNSPTVCFILRWVPHPHPPAICSPIGRAEIPSPWAAQTVAVRPFFFVLFCFLMPSRAEGESHQREWVGLHGSRKVKKIKWVGGVGDEIKGCESKWWD